MASSKSAASRSRYNVNRTVTSWGNSSVAGRLSTAETEIAEKFAQASDNYRQNPVALQLRGMNMLFEGLKEKGSLVIVPSSALESMNLGAIGGLAALAETSELEDEAPSDSA